MTPIQRVLIVGGTHGNELIGIHAVQRFEQFPDLIRRESFDTVTLLANPQAIAAGARYIDRDLNRSFSFSLTGPEYQQEYETQRAVLLRSKFGVDAQKPIDFIVDLHSTTANAGLMMILDQLNPFTLGLSAYISAIEPKLKVYCSANSGRVRDSVRSLAPLQVAIEVGAVAHGTLLASLFQKTEALVSWILDYVEQYNRGAIALSSDSITLYQYVQAVDYPKDKAGKLTAMIHPQLQFKDYEPLLPGSPMFITFEGHTIAYQGESATYPVFINEAAYYEKGIAMILTEKQDIQLESIK